MALYATGLELGVPVVFPSILERIAFVRPLYALWSQYTSRVLHPKNSLFAWGGTVRYLPPTEALNPKYDSYTSLHVLGMLFRNPLGFKKYAAELKTAFAPRARVKKRIESLLAQHTGKTLVGIHIRQRPFTYFPDGEFLLPPSRTITIIDEYMREHGLLPDEVVLVCVSDKPLVPKLTSAYTAIQVPKTDAFGFYLLTRCSVIIGTNSSFPNLAAWFGNIPHIVTDSDPIDWDYYRDQKTFFENKYATFTVRVETPKVQ
jgi:hypothetical protein